MREIPMYAIYDKVAATYMQPISVPTDGVAVRSVQDAMKQPNSPFGAHPFDYELYKLGHWDDTSGRITSLPVPELVVKLGSLVGNDQSAA